jgi:hypothetical protein
MPKVKLAGLLVLISTCLLGSAKFSSDWMTRADGPSVSEVVVSPISDPDPRDETPIAVSPKNDQVIVGASKVIQGGATLANGQGHTVVAYYFSSDGGSTWGNGLIGLNTPQKTWGRESDPSVSADLDGNFYICVLMLDNSSFDTGVYVFKSTDGGRTFGSPTPVVFDIGNTVNPRRADKCYMTVDVSPSSQFKNTVYAVWTSANKDDSGQNLAVVRFARRRAGDAGFSDSKAISHPGDMRGPSLATGPNGEFYAAWVGMPASILLLNASLDGGDTFFDLASKDLNIHNYIGSLEGPNAAFILFGLNRANSFPTIDVDRSTGPNRGTAYVAWAESTNGRNTDIFMSRITPRPGTLPDVSSPVKVNNDDSGADQFFPWLSVDSSSGVVEVAFYDRRDDPGIRVNMYLARSTDGGLSFKENTRISSASSDPTVQADISGMNSIAIGMGDYVGLAATRGKAHILWADTRHGKQEVFFGKVDFGSTSPPPPPPPTGLPGDNCQSPRVVAPVPYLDAVDTRSATSSSDDPVSCTGSQDTNTVWYALTSATNTEYGVDTSLSDYDTVVSVYTGTCGALTRVACNDDFGNPPDNGNRSLLTFSGTAGVTYLIEVSGKGAGGSLKIRIGYPIITRIRFPPTVPVFGDALEIDGAGFVSGNATVTAQLAGEDISLPQVFFFGFPLPDGTDTAVFASKKKLRKLLKHGSLLVRVESPVGSGRVSNQFLFTP